MIECPNCKHRNLEGLLFCEDCGTPLMIKTGDTMLLMTSVTHKLDASSESEDATAKPTMAVSDDAPPTYPSTNAAVAAAIIEPKNLKRNTVIMLHFLTENERVSLPVQDAVLLGRHDQRNTTQPDYDLTPHHAVEKGVSRHHALLKRRDNTLLIIDQKSANGTFVNGQRILPQEPRIIRDGDELRFGKLSARVLFK